MAISVKSARTSTMSASCWARMVASRSGVKAISGSDRREEPLVAVVSEPSVSASSERRGERQPFVSAVAENGATEVAGAAVAVIGGRGQR